MALRPITVAIVALGGQGGGVLTGWLVELAQTRGWLAQSTYVAGVAQRTGATVYCVEFLPDDPPEGHDPVFALYPVPGDVDLVVASELAEAGRAVQKGFVTPEETTLIASSHRAYGIDEKSALGDGRADSMAIYQAIEKAARDLVCFDMAEAALESGSIISAVMLGAIAGCGRLPFSREEYESVIRAGGKAVEANLAGFDAGFRYSQAAPEPPASARNAVEPEIRGPNGRALAGRVRQQVPEPAAELALHGALRALEYQDWRYAEQYLDRLERIVAADRAAGGDTRQFALTAAVAPPLALQMCFEDTIRVAELKTRPQRMTQIQSDLNAAEDQPYYVVEYFHPRFEELCDTLPAFLGGPLQRSALAQKISRPLFASGRNISTNKLTGYFMLRALAGLRLLRRASLRFTRQQQRIEQWLQRIADAAASDYDYALWLARCMELVQGYGETYERGLGRFEAAVAASEQAPPGRRAELLQQLHAAARADEEGRAFEAALVEART